MQYINFNKIGISLMVTTYFSVVICIGDIMSTISALMFLILYNVIFLFILYKLKLSKKTSAALVISMVFYTVLLFINLGSHLFFLTLPTIFITLNNIYFLFAMIKLSFQLRNIYKYNYLYANRNNFNPKPMTFLFTYYFGIILIFTFATTLINADVDYLKFGIRHYNLVTIVGFSGTCILFAYIYLFYKLLYKYNSACEVLLLSSSKKIDISLLHTTNSVAAHKWFKNNIEPYVYHAHYNEENGTITFDDEDDIINSNEHSEVDECNLDKSIAVINSLLENENSHEIAGILKSIIDKLNKMNNIHQEKYQFNKYIHHINERYIPYIKSMVQAYYNNMQLGSELTKTMQEKITASLEKIDDTFEKSIHEMYNKNILELESYMQAMDIMLNYKSAAS